MTTPTGSPDHGVRPPLTLLAVLRSMYPGWKISSESATADLAERWIAERRAKATPQSIQARIPQRLEEATLHELSGQLSNWTSHFHTLGGHRWQPPP